MFDIGFWELSIIGVVALIVIGPERLPAVARTAGLWLGKMKRVIGDMKSEIDKELKADELKKVLQRQADSAGIHEIIEEGKGALEDLNNGVTESENRIQAELNSPVDGQNGENAEVDKTDMLDEIELLAADADDDGADFEESTDEKQDSTDGESETASTEKTG